MERDTKKKKERETETFIDDDHPLLVSITLECQASQGGKTASQT